MPLPDDIHSVARETSQALEDKLDTADFQPFAARMRPEWLRLIQARRAFRESGGVGCQGLLATAQSARDAAGAVQPNRSSVDAACAQVGRLSTNLLQASGSTGKGQAAPATPTGLRGALRIAPGRTAAGTRGPAADQTDDGAGNPNYYQKLTNLFPAEALALYGTGVALFGGATLFVVLAVLIILLLLRAFATQPAAGGPPQWPAVVVAAASFLLWATAADPAWISGIWRWPTEDLRRGAAFLGAALVILAPLIVKPKH